MRRLTVLMLTAMAACLLAGGVLAGGAWASTTPRWGEHVVLTDAQKQTKLLEILDRFVTQVEPTWTTVGSAGYFHTPGAGSRYDRSNAMIAQIYGLLLAVNPDDRARFGVSDEYERATLRSHLDDLLEWLVSIHIENWRGDPREAWGGDIEQGVGDWMGPFIASQAAFGAAIAQTDVDDDIEDDIFEILRFQADAVVEPGDPDPWNRGNGDSGGEETGGYSNAPAAARALFSTDPRASDWDGAAKRMSFNALGRAADESDSTVMDGRTVASWVESANLYDDFTMENHHIMHPAYLQAVVGNLAENEMMYVATGMRTIPAAFGFRRQEIWDNVLAPLLAEDGDFVSPSGTDWANHDYQHLSYLAAMATLLSGDDAEVASVLESRAILELERRQLGEGNGSLIGTGSGNVGYEVDLVRQAFLAWMMHENFPNAPEPTEAQFEDALAPLEGVREFTNNKIVTMKGPHATASMSWDNSRYTHPTALIVPSARDHRDDPVMVQNWIKSGVGNTAGDVASYSCDCSSDDYFSTAGVIDDTTDRWFSMTSWADDGTTLLLDRGVGSTFNFAFEHYRALDGRRPVYTESGTKSNESFTGDWLNVDDRWGMIVKGGAGMRTDEYADPNPHEALRDPHIRVEGSTGDGSRNRAAVVLPTATAAKTRALAADMDQGSTGDANWSAASARGLDGRARIAVARWGGSGTTTVSGLTSSLGAPIPDRNADTTVNSSSEASMSVTLGSPDSVGWKGYFFVRSNQSVTVRPQSASTIKLTTGGSSTTVTISYVNDTGVEQSVTRTIAANTVTYADAVGGELAMPVASATSSESGFPASRATDFDTGTYWVSSSVDLSRSPQDLTVDFGREIEVGKVVMNPRSNLGPRDYEIKYAASGCAAYTSAQRVATAHATNTTTTTLSTPVKAQCVRITISSQYGGGPPGQVQVEELNVAPTDVDVDVLEPNVNLARSGWNSVKVRVRNNTGSSTSVTVGTSLSGATGVSASVSPSSTPTVPANGYTDVFVELATTGSTPTTGTGTLTVSATGARSETSTLEFTSNLALNDNRTRFPAAVSSTQEAGWMFGPSFANDGDTSGGSNFWVADAVGDLGDHPQCLMIDLGRSVTVGRLTMTPRTNFGPRDYVVQTWRGPNAPKRDCNLDTSDWTPQDIVSGATNGVARNSSWSPVSTRWVRIQIVDTHGSGPPYYTQVRELALAPS